MNRAASRSRRGAAVDVDLVLMERLCLCVEPFFGWVRREVVMALKPQREYLRGPEREAAIDAARAATGRTYAWDYGRVRYFVERIEAGDTLDPVMLESQCDQPRLGQRIYWGRPFIEDGNHRVAAAAVCGLKTIPVSFSGLVTTINWLTGRRARRPAELR